MVDVTRFLAGLSPVQGKTVVARFDGGRLSSEGGCCRGAKSSAGRVCRTDWRVVRWTGARRRGPCIAYRRSFGWHADDRRRVRGRQRR
jgi:hypothetical protein